MDPVDNHATAGHSSLQSCQKKKKRRKERKTLLKSHANSRNPQEGHMLCIKSGLHSLESRLTEWCQKISIPRHALVGNSFKKDAREEAFLSGQLYPALPLPLPNTTYMDNSRCTGGVQVGPQTAEDGRVIRQAVERLCFLNMHLRRVNYSHILGTQLWSWDWIWPWNILFEPKPLPNRLNNRDDRKGEIDLTGMNYATVFPNSHWSKTEACFSFFHSCPWLITKTTITIMLFLKVPPHLVNNLPYRKLKWNLKILQKQKTRMQNCKGINDCWQKPFAIKIFNFPFKQVNSLITERIEKKILCIWYWKG